MSNLSVGEGTQITLHFSLALEGGEEIDTNFGGAPATFTFGDGSLLPGFEKVLVGLSAGDKKQCVIAAEDAFGHANPKNVLNILRSTFSDDVPLEMGLVVSFRDSLGGERPGVISAINDQHVVVDFNHPLAGRAICFSVHIIAVVPAVTH